MATNFTPIVNGDARGNDAAIWNDPMNQLDAALGNPALSTALSGANVHARLRTAQLLIAAAEATLNSRIDSLGVEAGNANAEVTAARTAINYLAAAAPASLSDVLRFLGRKNYYPEAYGAIADGNNNPLSGIYANLAAAVTDYGSTVLPSLNAVTISFDAGTKRISDSANNLERFRNLCKIVVSGSTSNDGTYTLTKEHDAAGAYLTTVEALVTEAAGASVDITIDWSNTEIDWCAIQYCIHEASTNGGFVVLASDTTYKTNHPLVAEWNSTRAEFPLIDGMIGGGDRTIISADIASPFRAAVEWIGNSNTYSASGELSGFQVNMVSTSDDESFCLRVGDCKGKMACRALKLVGANGIALKIASSSSYAQMNTIFEHVDIVTNNGLYWYADDDDAEVYAVYSESGGAFWDNVTFRNCTFRGLVQTRARIAKFDTCQFLTNPDRGGATINSDFGCCVVVRLGNAMFHDCYWEDYLAAVKIIPSLADIERVTFDNCRMTAADNSASGNCEYGIFMTTSSSRHIGSIVVRNHTFGASAFTHGTADIANQAAVCRTMVLENIYNGNDPDVDITITGKADNMYWPDKADYQGMDTAQMADDSALTIAPLSSIGILVLMCKSPLSNTTRNKVSGIIAYDTATPHIQIMTQAGTTIEGTGAGQVLAGTTGTDAKFTVSASGGLIYLENRLGTLIDLAYALVG